MKDVAQLAWLIAANVLVEIAEVCVVIGISGHICYFTNIPGVIPAIGVFYAHVLFFGVLLAMGPWKWQVRVPVLLGSYLVVATSEYLVFQRWLHDGATDEVYLWLMASTVPLLLILQLPLGPRFRWWRLKRITAETMAVETTSTFTIRDLFIWTTIVALVLAVGRLLMVLRVDGPSSPTQDLIGPAITVGVMLLFNLLVAWPTIWAICSRQWLGRLVIAVVIAVAASFAEVGAFVAFVPRAEFLAGCSLVMPMNLATCLSFALHLSILRQSGYELAS